MSRLVRLSPRIYVTKDPFRLPERSGTVVTDDTVEGLPAPIIQNAVDWTAPRYVVLDPQGKCAAERPERFK